MLIRSAPGGEPVLPQLHRRARWALVVVALAFGGLLARLWQLQLTRGERYFERALSNVVHQRHLPSVRGKILDRNGVALVDNRPAFNFYVTPVLFSPAQEEAFTRLLGLGDEEAAQVHGRVEAGRARDPRLSVLVLEDQGRDRAALVAQASQELAGVQVVDEPHRRYLHEVGGATLAAHVLGYMNQLNAQELAELGPQGYDSTEFIGRYGIERQWENYLRGKKGIERYTVDANGHRLADEQSASLIDGPRFVPPEPGHNVVLTLDLELQRTAEKAVRRNTAAAIAVVEVDTGRILALVSKPAFDSNVMTGHLSQAEEAMMLADPRKPFIDKAVRQVYPPGSTYKIVAAVAGLEDGVVDETTVLTCPGSHEVGGQRFGCGGTHGKMTMVDAIEHSCNVYFWKVAERIGIDRLAQVSLDFGFGVPTGVGLNGESSGRVPTRAWYEQRGDPFRIGYTLNTATGQGDVEVTVLQLAMAYAAIANGGRLWVPQLVRRVETAHGRVVADYPPELRRQVKASPTTLDVIRRGMWAAVNAPGGTAYVAHSTILEFAGKTGTAQVGRGKKEPDVPGWHPRRDHAWFAGFGPFSHPEIAVVVLIEHGGRGGAEAGPVAREIFEGYVAEQQAAAAAASSAASAAAGPGAPGAGDAPGAATAAAVPTAGDTP